MPAIYPKVSRAKLNRTARKMRVWMRLQRMIGKSLDCFGLTMGEFHGTDKD
jgi:hypothetical protein